MYIYLCSEINSLNTPKACSFHEYSLDVLIAYGMGKHCVCMKNKANG